MGEVGRGDGFDIRERQRFDDFSESEFGKVSKSHRGLQSQRPVSALNHRENYSNYNTATSPPIPQVSSARKFRPRSAIQGINGPQRSDYNIHSNRDQIVHTSRFASGGNGDGDHQESSKDYGHRVKEMKQLFEPEFSPRPRPRPHSAIDEQYLSPRIFRTFTPKPAASARARRRIAKDQDSEKKSEFRNQSAKLESDDEASIYCTSSGSEKCYLASDTDSDNKSIDNKSKIIRPINNQSKSRIRKNYSSQNIDQDYDANETEISATESLNGERGSGSEFSELLIDDGDSGDRNTRRRYRPREKSYSSGNSVGDDSDSTDEIFDPEEIKKMFATSENYLADSNDIVDLNEDMKFFKMKENSEELDYDLTSIMNDTGGFAMQPVPYGVTLKCRITRDRKGMNKNFYPVYFLHLETNDGKKIPVLGARKRKKTATSSYIISKDPTNLSRKGDEFLGKLRSGLKGLHFDVYDKGMSPKSKVSFSDIKNGSKVLRQELLSIKYDLNILGLKGPRKMKFTIPRMVSQFKRVEIRPASLQETILQKSKNGDLDELVELVNKKPHWHPGSQSYVLNFKGRVTIASVKNFQVVHPNNDKYIVLQFGRVGDNIFSLDINYPLCPMQAFGIVLSSFDDKYACQ